MNSTEMINKNTENIDKMSAEEIVNVMQSENYNAVRAIENAKTDIAKAIDAAANSISHGGRIFYVGAGTSGRLGVLDAAECPPTFGVSQNTVIGIIAGGEKCLTRAAENEEDNRESGRADLEIYNLTPNDTVVGISASGGAEYVAGALEYANSKKSVTVSVTNNFNTKIEKAAQINIVADTGAEVIAGSTRLKAGSAQKMILNMISTGAMVRTGKVYKNLMVNLKPSNEKLARRTVNIVSAVLKCSETEAKNALEKSGWDIKAAIGAAGTEEKEND